MTSPNISWSSTGLVTLNNVLIAGSNISDLIAGALDQHYSNQNQFSPGKDVFERFVRRLKGARYRMTITQNIPNQNVQQQQQQQQAAASIIQTTPVRQQTPSLTPTQPQRRYHPAIQTPPVINQTPTPQRVSRKATKNKPPRTENIYKKQYKDRVRKKKQSGGSKINPDKWLIYK
ncbi:unnamed protein product [Rotaria magnacalcarata]|uniref:Uncharacterized protein n=1 Tax=Rotaria magnacalcarata TaxID=392030 RepID=A0A816ZCE8_9BILA|nr:unnamed protein product [Rotaria magnacalcarata]